jgi:hypothetical protein
VFGGVDAVKEDMENMRRGAPMTPGLRARVGLLIQNKGNTIDMSVPPEWFGHLQQEVLIKHGFAWINDFKEFRLTPKGVDLGIEEARKLHKPLAIRNPVNFSGVLQCYVRDMRADLDTMMRLPSINKFWWRGVMWQFRRWWAGTNPEQKRLPPPGPTREPWTDADGALARAMWIESHYTAFWLCPEGVEAGIEKLNEFDAKKFELGPNATQVIDAVESIARHCALLPAPKPKSVIEHIEEKMFDKSGDFSFEEFADRHGQILKVQWQGEAGRGKTHSASDMTNDQLRAFIQMDATGVHATQSEIEKADVEAILGIAELSEKINGKALKKGKPKKPQQFVLFDQFNKAFTDLRLAEIEAKNKEVPYRVGIPIENPCYLHAHECDCKPVRRTGPRRPPPSVK